MSRCPAGVDVVVQGSPAHAFYAVDEGRVVVHRDGACSRISDAGDSFGERGLLDNAPRNATVTTEVETPSCCASRVPCCSTSLEQAPMLTDGARPQRGRPGCRRRARGRAGVGRRPALGRRMSVDGRDGRRGRRRLPRASGRSTSAWPSSARAIVIVDEAGHWSERLVEDGVAEQLDRDRRSPATPDADAAAVRRRARRGGRAAGRRPDVLGDARAGRGAGGGRARAFPATRSRPWTSARSKLRTRERVRARRPADAEVARVQSLDELYAAAADDRVPGRGQAGVRRERRRDASGSTPRVAPEHLLARAQRARDHERRRSPRGQRPRRWRSTSTASSSTSTSCSTTASASSRACPRTGRPPSPRFRRPDFTARPITAPSARSAGSWSSSVADGPGVRVHARRAARRGQVHVAGAAHRRGQRAAWAVGGSSRSSRPCGAWTDRGARCARRSGSRRQLDAEPEAALCRRRHVRLRAGDRAGWQRSASTR